jgi:hypothetical protein
MAGSGGQFSLLRFELRDDLTVGPAHMSRDTPDIRRAEEAVCAHAHYRLGCPAAPDADQICADASARRLST